MAKGNGKDQVMSPTQKSRAGGIKGVKQGIIEGPTHQPGKYTPFTRNQKPSGK